MPKRMDTVEPDWSWTEDPLVLAAVERVCKEYSKRGSAKLSFHEAFAEASTYISFRPDKFLDITYDAEGVERRNWNTARIVDRLGYVLHGTPGPREQLLGDYSEYEEEGFGARPEDALRGVQPAPLSSSGTYDRVLAAKLIEAMYNEWVIYDEYRPDSDMPRARPNPAKSGTWMAHKIDIERSWDHAPLDGRSRLILAAVHGFGWTHKEIGAELGLSAQRAHAIADAAMETLVATLNGEYR